jgi:hypothetical protein
MNPNRKKIASKPFKIKSIPNKIRSDSYLHKI